MPLKDRLKMRHLRTLVAIAEHGSLVRAAKALSISQPAVTKTLAELEDIAGHRLFERSPKGVTLTGAGQILVGTPDPACGQSTMGCPACLPTKRATPQPW